MSLALRDRWKSREGQALAAEAVGYLLGSTKALPQGFGFHEGRIDLRGLEVSSPVIGGTVSAGGTTFKSLSGVVEVRDAEWNGLDLSQARLGSFKLFDSEISNCWFDQAYCRGWRLWDSRVGHSSFGAADLRDAAIGTGTRAGSVAWRDVSFDLADMRGVLAKGALIERCTFRGSKLSNSEFLQSTLRDCVFAGTLRDVLFDCREVDSRPTPGVLVNLDFSQSTFEDVEFRGAHFEGLKLPSVAGIYVIPAFPQVARRALELLDGNTSMGARMLRAQFANSLKLPGSADSVDIFNRRDYLASGGESLADLAETVFMEAIADVTP